MVKQKAGNPTATL